jgi:hypothetical protein
MDDLSPSRPARPSRIEKYAPGEAPSDGGNRKRKSSTDQLVTRDKEEPPEVGTEPEERHQLDERA